VSEDFLFCNSHVVEWRVPHGKEVIRPSVLDFASYQPLFHKHRTALQSTRLKASYFQSAAREVTC